MTEQGGIWRWDGPVPWNAEMIRLQEHYNRVFANVPRLPEPVMDFVLFGETFFERDQRGVETWVPHPERWAEAYRVTHAGWTFWRVYRDQYAVPRHMVVWDRQKVRVQIEALLDPDLAVCTWVYDRFGIVVHPHQARIIAAIEKGEIGLPPHWRSLPR